MSTHDYIIADASGSAFLADLNLAVKALAENNSSTTEPAVMYAHMWWADTTADILKKRNAANTGWISYLTLSTGAPLVTSGTWAGTCATATTATIANRTDSGEVTVTAHATTGDIFAAAANSILWDDAGGSITTTAFPAATKAGMTRDLRLNGASKFMAGANFLIEGINSGNTITLGAGALCHVRAITTTQFKMTYSYSGSFTATASGFSGTSPTMEFTFKNENGTTRLSSAGGGGTSNATTFSLSGIPSSLNPTNTHIIGIVGGSNNGANAYVPVRVLSTGGIDFWNGFYGTAWTSSGSKSVLGLELSYTMN